MTSRQGRTPVVPQGVDDTAPELTARLPKDLRRSALSMPAEQVRVLVDQYYGQQEQRIAGQGRLRAFLQGKDALSPEGRELTEWLLERFKVGEDAAKAAITTWAKNQGNPTAWAMEQYGIGPILAAGLTCHIDITQAPTVGSIWSFAGLDPNTKWGKGEKRPWNADLKVLCWKISDSFVRFSYREECIYGQIYAERKDLEIQRNLAGHNEVAARRALLERNFRESGTRACYEGRSDKCNHVGKGEEIPSGPHLPPGRVDARARRFAVKTFLGHWHTQAYRAHYGVEPPLPYAEVVIPAMGDWPRCGRKRIFETREEALAQLRRPDVMNVFRCEIDPHHFHFGQQPRPELAGARA